MHAVSRASVNTDFLSGGGKEGRRLYVAGGKALRKDRIGIQKKCSSLLLLNLTKQLCVISVL